jgi:hypothetical protein
VKLRPVTRAGRSFTALVALGLGAEGGAAWLAYRWAADVLPCQWGRARELFGPGTACPMPIALVGDHTLVPVVLCGALVLTSVVIFARSFTAIALGTRRAKQQLARHAVTCQLPAAFSAASSGDFDRLVVIEEERPTAFCVGLWRPRVVVSTGLLEKLVEPALKAVFEHELSHRRRRDPLRRALAKSVARGLFFVPSLSDLADVVPAEGEVAADAAAVGSTAGREVLARALHELLSQLPCAGGSGGHGRQGPRDAAPEGPRDRATARARLRPGRLGASAVAVAVLLGVGAWLPRPVHVIVLTPHVVSPPPVGSLGQRAAHTKS